MFKDIVCAITPSQISECATDKAIHFAQRFDARLYLIHVCGMESAWSAIPYLEASGETDRIRQDILKHYGDKLAGMKDNFDLFVVAGMPDSEILRIARKVNADIIIMGPHTKEYNSHRSRMWGMAGSTLEKVSRKARCPVMIVNQDTPYGEQRFLKILAATDFSVAARYAVTYAGQIARQYNAGITVLHVLDPSDAASRKNGKQIASVAEQIHEDYGERLRGIRDCCYECREGDPAEEILEFARTRSVDVILMAHHSKESDPKQAFLGSTVTRVALNSECPTMSVNHHFDMRCGLIYDQTGEIVKA